MSKGIKNLFGKGSNKIVTNEQSEQLPEEVESEELVAEVKKTNERFFPRVDFSDPQNFARYGSAEKYYEDAISHIYKTFPYDGSGAEKSLWHREASYLDNWFFDTLYPRTTGYVKLNSASPHSTTTIGGEGVYASFLTPQHISFKGGPHKDPSAAGTPGIDEMSKQFPPKDGKANIWEADNKKTSNLEFDPTNGNTVEFWLKYDDANIVNSASTNRAHVLFDMWNGQAIGTSGYVRFMVERLPSAAGDFQVTYMHGSTGVERLALSLTATSAALPENAWQHVAITVKNSGSQILGQLYYNGMFEAQALGGADITTADVPPEALRARINGYLTQPKSGGAYAALTEGTGGAENVYLDEFRYWKRERAEKNIGRFWFTQISGGTNTDVNKYSGSADPVDLGVYYKFNEGIVDTVEVNALDANVIDYSGRLSNGSISNYTVQVRSTGSAMDEATQVDSDDPEYKDPVLYSSHPSVSTLMSTMKLSGSTHDMKNNAAFYHTMPNWITEEDEEKGRYAIKELVQALSSYFDTLHLQIEALPHMKESFYSSMESGTDKPYSFVNHLVRSLGMEAPDLFVEATALEEVMSRGEQEVFDLKIQEIKNIIYQNIYNNLPYIYKSKGTEKAFRNLIRCFGVDEELIKINLYADNTDYTLKDTKRFTAIKKNFMDCNDRDRNEGIVYSSENDGSVTGTTADATNTRTFLAGTTAARAALLSTTFEAEVVFPKRMDLDNVLYIRPDFFRVALFGSKRANSAGGSYAAKFNEQTPDHGNFQVWAVKSNYDSKDAKFVCSFGGGLSGVTLETNTYKDIYDNTKWNFAVRCTPNNSDLGNRTLGSAAINYDTDYTLEFYGVQTNLDVVEHEFKLQKIITAAQAIDFIRYPKRFHVGAFNLNPTSAGTIDKSNIKASGIRFWYDYLTDEEIKLHAFDATNAGRLNPTEDAYAFFSELSSGTTTDIRVPRKDTLAFHWDFSNVLTSDADGEFFVDDVSGGSAAYVAEARYGWFTPLVGYRHTAKGNYFPASSNQVVNREYQYTAKQKLPEILNSDDLVDIRVQDDDTFGKDARPINHFFAIEKSMYQVISDEMINLFASIVEFNDLIGQPVNRYRLDYKMLGKLRSLFYEKVENVPSLEKYVEFYKWLDSSLGYMLQELIPASGNFSDSMRTLIESHVLERNKYWTKFPTLEMKQDPPEGQLLGIREMLYDWEHGHAPIMAPATATIAIADAGGIFHGDTFTLVDSAGVSTVYTINGGVAPASGGGSGGAATVGFSGVGGGAAGKIKAAAAMVTAINATTDANYTAVSDGVDTVTITQGGAGLAGNRTNNDSISSTTVSNFTGGTGSDTPDNCLWWGERTERTWDSFDTSAEVDTDREKIRQVAFRDIKGPTKKVGNDPDRHIVDLYDHTTDTTYEGRTYAVRRLAKPYRLRVEEQKTIVGGQNIPHATQSPNQVIRAATPIRASGDAGVEVTAYVDDPANCKDEFKIDQDGPNAKVRRAFKVTLKDALGIETPLKGSLVLPATYADFPNDTTPAVASAVYHSDTYGEDNEVPMQGPFTSQWVGGNQHRHVTLSTELATEALATRPELYLRTGSPVLYRHPHDIDEDYPIARWMRGETAKRPVNIENIKSIAGQRDRASSNQTPLGNYTYDYDIVQTVGRSSNNRWLTKRVGDSSVHTSLRFDGSTLTNNVMISSTVPPSAAAGALAYAVTTPWTWSLWFKKETNGTKETLIGKMFNASTKGYEITIESDNKIMLLLQQNTSGPKKLEIKGSTAVTDTNWHHLAIVYNGGAALASVSMFLDGVAETEVQVSDTLGTGDDIVNTTSAALHFGRRNLTGTANPFQGSLDEISWWNRELTYQEVRDLYKRGRHALLNTGSSHLQPSHYWRMVRHGTYGTGATIADLGTIGGLTGYTPLIAGATFTVEAGDSNINALPFQIANNNGFYSSAYITNTAHGATPAYPLYDFTLPDRSVNSTRRFGTSDHVFVNRFAAPGSPAVSARGALDAESEEYSPYNSLNWRNLLVRNHLNFWHTDHSRWGGYRDDYIHGLPADSVGPFDGTTPEVASWHKNNRNAVNRMYLKGTDNPATHAASYGWERDYDNFFISHQIPRSDWQYKWIADSATEAHVSLPLIGGVSIAAEAVFTFASAHGLQVGDEIYIDKVDVGMIQLNNLPQPFKVKTVPGGGTTATFRDATGAVVNTSSGYTPFSGTTTAFWFPVPNDSEVLTTTRTESAVGSVHPRHLGFTSSFPNANTSTDNVVSGSYKYRNPANSSIAYLDVDFVYGNTVVVEPVDFTNNFVGFSCSTRCSDLWDASRSFLEQRLQIETDNRTEGANQSGETPEGGNLLQVGWTLAAQPSSPALHAIQNIHFTFPNPCKTQYINSTSNRVAALSPLTSELNALLLNRNGPYQFPSWKSIRHYEHPIVRGQRYSNILTVQDVPKVRELRIPTLGAAAKGIIKVVTAPNSGAAVTTTLVYGGATYTANSAAPVSSDATERLYGTAEFIASSLKQLIITSSLPLEVKSSTGSKQVLIMSTETGTANNEITYRVQCANGSFSVIKADGTYSTAAADTANNGQFSGGVDRSFKVQTFRDRRSDTHKFYKEPPVAWNRPMRHTIATPANPIKIQHTYSNNIECFANPKLTARLGVYRCTDNQIYNRLLEKYSPAIADKVQLDFVEIRYKEYIFPKHRHVGLLKVRNRMMYDENSRQLGGRLKWLRTFWKDSAMERIRPAESPNAVGYKFTISQHKQFRQRDSIWAMDDFWLREQVGANSEKQKVLGDLAYVGKERYNSWIAHKKCVWSFSKYYVSEPNGFMAAAPSSTLMKAVVSVAAAYSSEGLSASSTDIRSSDYSYSPPPDEVAFTGHGAESAYDDPHWASSSSSSSSSYSATLMRTDDFSGTAEFYDADAGADIGAAAYAIGGSSHTYSEAGGPTAYALGPQLDTFYPTLVLMAADARCEAPRPAIQFYYNPWNSEWCEDGWKYRTNILANRNPWYNSYDDYNLDIRTIGQNYGLLAEFRISQHMDKYVQNEGGNFRAKNFNFLSLDGASYDTYRHIGKTHTQFSGKTTVSYKKVFSKTGAGIFTVSAYPTMADFKMIEDAALLEHLSATSEQFNKETAGLVLRNLNATQNNAWYYSKTDETIAPDFTYRSRNPVIAGGSFTIQNSKMTTFDIGESNPNNRAPSWTDFTLDDGTGRRCDPESASVEACKDTSWKSIRPPSYGTPAAIDVNVNGAADEYLIGFVDLLQELDVDNDGAKEVAITSIDMHNNKVADSNNHYGGGTPFSVSIWAAPAHVPVEGTGQQRHEGLWTFGEYERDGDSWYNREHMTPAGSIGLWSSCPAPESLMANYPKGMGLTFFMRESSGIDGTIAEVNPPVANVPIATSQIFHFFNEDGTPALLNPQTFNHVMFQYLPAPQASRSPKVKLWLNGKVLYGIQAYALIDTSGDFKKVGHSACPLDSAGGNVWGNAYGATPTASFSNLNSYKIGKANFVDKDDILALDLVEDELSAAQKFADSVRYDYFQGRLAEFSLWSGILSSKDVERIHNAGSPCNILEEMVNQEIRGGYTDVHMESFTTTDPSFPVPALTDGRSTTYSDKDWGTDAPTVALITTQANTPSDQRKAIGYTVAETRSRGAALAAWHHLGVPYKTEVDSTCEDWDDEFFNTYAHTDNIKFFDMVVEDHNGVGENPMSRVRLRVNAVKKLLPYRGFYPQDRTVQIAGLFADKMVPNILPNDKSEEEHHLLHHSQAVQAALQPFFAPGILYNSIKAGIAVDWAAFTNKSGMEPSYWGDEVILPYPEDTKDGTALVNLTAPAPTWYAKRNDSFDTNEGLALGASADTYPDTSYLLNSQPKFLGDASEYRDDLGYIIVDEPTTRIPFEGLVSLDTALATTEQEEVDAPPVEGTFKHIDLEIDGWDAEGVTVHGYQPVSKPGSNGLPQDSAEQISRGNYDIYSWSVSIGDPDLQTDTDGDDSPEEWDVNIDFRTAPDGMKVPNGTIGSDGYGYVSISEFDPDLLAGGTGHGVTTKAKLNEEIAVKLCRAINKRDDIHYVAIPGYCPNYRWGNTVSAINGRSTFVGSDMVTMGVSDDHIARVFPVVYPKICGIDEVRINAPVSGTDEFSTQPWAPQADDASVWLKDGAGEPQVGLQGNGKWRIRLIYVGPLEPSVIDPTTGTLGGAGSASKQAVDDDDGVYNEIKYYKWAQGNVADGLSSAVYTPVEEVITDTPEDKFYIRTLSHSGVLLGWKELHVINPEDMYSYEDDLVDGAIFGTGASVAESLPDGWYSSSGVPKTFFDGGAWQALDPNKYPDAKTMLLGDLCGVSAIRHLGVVTKSSWMPGYGWFGYANYSLDTELGVRLVDPSGTTVYGSFNGVDAVTRVTHWTNWFLDNPNFSTVTGTPDWIALSAMNSGGSQTVELSEGAKPKQGPIGLYGGVDLITATGVRVTPKPSQVFLMAPEYYTGSFTTSFETAPCTEGDELKCYLYPYFEWTGEKGDPRYEMAMHNFLAEVPNFFLKRKGFVTFTSKRENEFKTMVAGTTYYMDVTLYRKNISTVRSPYDDTEGDSFQGAYYGPAFRWKALDKYESAADWRKDPSQAPYAPPYLYGKSIARISFTCPETKKYSLDEIMSRAQSEALSPEVLKKFQTAAGAALKSSYMSPSMASKGTTKSEVDVESSPAYKARMPVAASVNLFGKSRLKNIQYDAQGKPNFTDAVEVTQQQFVPLVASEPENSEQDVWVISPKFECPVLNFENSSSSTAMQLLTPSFVFQNATPTDMVAVSTIDKTSVAEITRSFIIDDSLYLEVGATEVAENACLDSGTGIWAGLGRVPNPDEGVFITVEESFKQSANDQVGSLLDVCGFESSTAKIGELADEKEISEAVIMIPFVDNPSDSGAQTTLVDNRHFFKISKNLFNLQKSNVEKGVAAVGVQEWEGIGHEIWETSISRMIRMMKKYNIPPKYDFVTYPLGAAEDPFVMYIFEFNHKFDKEDLSNIWQGISPKIATRAEYDTQELIHDLSPVDFFEAQKMPSNIRWLTFKVKRKANTNYFAATASNLDDNRFKFDFEVGEKTPEYSYNWPYDFFTMVELAQVEGGIDISERPSGIDVVSYQGELSTQQQVEQAHAATGANTSVADQLGVGPIKKSDVFGDD